MTKEEFAALLNGREYGDEITKAEEKQAKEAGLIVIFGYSDDNVELRGVIDDEIGAYDGTTLHISRMGLLQPFDSLDHDDEEEMQKYFDRKQQSQWIIEAKWCDKEIGASWSFETKIPHATFDIMEDGELFCRGIVFAAASL